MLCDTGLPGVSTLPTIHSSLSRRVLYSHCSMRARYYFSTRMKTFRCSICVTRPFPNLLEHDAHRNQTPPSTNTEGNYVTRQLLHILLQSSWRMHRRGLGPMRLDCAKVHPLCYSHSSSVDRYPCDQVERKRDFPNNELPWMNHYQLMRY